MLSSGPVTEDGTATPEGMVRKAGSQGLGHATHPVPVPTTCLPAVAMQ